MTVHQKKYIVIFVSALLISCVQAFLFREKFMDDAFIAFRYVHNFVKGNGFYYNIGEKVEGITNIGWAFLLIPPSFFLQTTVAAKIAAFVLSAATYYLLSITVLKKTESIFFSVFSIICLGVMPFFAYFMHSGMETPLVAFLFVVFILSFSEQPHYMRSAIIGGLLFLVRPEMVFVFPIMIGLHCMKKLCFMNTFFHASAVFAFFVLLVTLFRYIYFGSFVPNTFYAKISSVEMIIYNAYAIFTGQSVNMPLFLQGVSGAFLLSFVIVYIVFYGKEEMLAALAILIVSLFFAFYVAQDWTDLPRYFMPSLPVVFLVFIVVAAELVDKDKIKERFEEFNRRSDNVRAKPVYFTAFLSIFITAFIYSLAVLGESADAFYVKKNKYPGYVLFGTKLIKAAKAMAPLIPDSTTIATRRIGVIGYYTNAKIFDYKFGLIHKDIALLVSKTKKRSDSLDDQRLKPYWDKYGPDFILEDDSVLKRLLKSNRDNVILVQGEEYQIVARQLIGADGEGPVYWSLAKRIGR